VAVTASNVVLNATGPTAIVASAVTGYAGQVIVRSLTNTRTVVLGSTGAAIWIGGSATGATGTGATGTMALVPTFPITLSLGPQEGVYGVVGTSGNSNISVLITGG
jgi:hypothetical protein